MKIAIYRKLHVLLVINAHSRNKGPGTLIQKFSKEMHGMNKHKGHFST